MNSSILSDGKPATPVAEQTAMYRRSTCRLCDSRDLELVLSLTPTPPVDAFLKADHLADVQPRYPLELYLCGACGHAQLLDVVSPEILFGDYIYETSSSPGLVEHFRKYAEEVTRAVRPLPEGLAVDIGSNDGTLLRFFKAYQLRVVGVDPAAEIARRACASGIETRPEFFQPHVAEQIRREYGPASIVTANNVFAHVDNLAAMADGMRTLLADDGVFVFEVSYILDMINGMIFDLIYHEHLSYHALKPLASFLKRHGMELIHVEHNTSKGGSLRCMAQRIGGPRTASGAVASMIEHEGRIGLLKPEIYRAWAKRVDEVSTQISALVAELRAGGRTIAGYGASATGTVLTYRWNLGEVLEFLVDDIPERQGRFSPGHHIPVLSADSLYERKPDYVLVLAWRFAAMIISKHQAYLDQGGHFIVPLPQQRIV